MPHVVFHHSDGDEVALTVPDGITVMRAAVGAGVRGIVGECGGQAMCATCHVYVRNEFLSSLPEMGEDEDEMLSETAFPRDLTRSRLGCQIHLTDALPALEVDVPGT